MAGIHTVATHHTPAHVHSMGLAVDAGTLATACTQATTVATVCIKDRTIQRLAGEETQNGAHGTNGVAPSTSATPCQYAYNQQSQNGYHQSRNALQPHIHRIESITPIVLCQRSQSVVGQLIQGSHQGSHYSSISAVGHQESCHPAHIEDEHDGAQQQKHYAHGVAGRTVLVLVFLPAQT